MNIVIGVLYSCHLCGLKDIEVFVKAREDEEVLDWMDHTLGPAIAGDHAARKPDCHPRALNNVKIPVGAADRVGGPPIQ